MRIKYGRLKIKKNSVLLMRLHADANELKDEKH